MTGEEAWDVAHKLLGREVWFMTKDNLGIHGICAECSSKGVFTVRAYNREWLIGASEISHVYIQPGTLT